MAMGPATVDRAATTDKLFADREYLLLGDELPDNAESRARIGPMSTASMTVFQIRGAKSATPMTIAAFAKALSTGCILLQVGNMSSGRAVGMLRMEGTVNVGI